MVELQLNIKIESFQALQEKVAKTIEREVDFLYRVFTKDQKELLLHLEFQTEDDKEMLYRMVEYHGLIYRKYQLPIHHIVIYLGSKKEPKMLTKLPDNAIFSGFDLINLHKLDTKKLLSSQIPEVVLLALLSDYDQQQTEVILRSIIIQLKKVVPTNRDFGKYVEQLLMLSRLRKIEPITTKILSDMPIMYDIEQDALYKMGMEKEREKWEKERKSIEAKLKRLEAKNKLIEEEHRKQREQMELKRQKEKERMELERQKEKEQMELERQKEKERMEQMELERQKEKEQMELEKIKTVKSLLQAGSLTDAQIIEITSITPEFLRKIKEQR